MVEKEVLIKSSVGLHARPAALLVKVAQRFASDVHLESGKKTANAKSILAILSLAAGQGATIKIVAAGSDENMAVDSIVSLIDSNFEVEAP